MFFLFFFFQKPNVLSLSNFSSLFEVFLGIGFTFYGLTKIDDFLLAILGLKNVKDNALHESIDTHLSLADELIEESKIKDKPHFVYIASKTYKDLTEIKKKIDNEKTLIVYNSRFSFLTLGVNAFVFLLLCGIESYCVQDPNRQPCYYNTLLFANITFLVYYFLLHKYTFQPDPEESVLIKIIVFILVLIIMMIAGYICPLNPFAPEIIIGFSIFLLLIPFILLLNRHEKYRNLIKKQDYENKANNLYTELLDIKKEFGRKIE